ncbi:MAG TPA: tRNA epoxyqueuosine(34) reductase QueG [Phycisphaerae bacterium]|nr:tRNA epoxyqueuosine(34) reductase QueG [Phycisphaerae bacterium]HNU44877.1 tRNA epoxyqueuosine(34) reductase QueG [Phycisphaerae bacterium]
MEPAELTNLIKGLAHAAGFERCGIAQVGLLPRADYLTEWLAHGMHGEMQFLQSHRELLTNPHHLIDGARSLIVLARVYGQKAPAWRPEDDGLRGRVACYAWGEDYHVVLREQLHGLADAIRDRVGREVPMRVCVDTAPLVEREWAARAGVGWIGKNTLVLHPRLGSYTFLGVLVTTLELVPDEPMPDHCGTCTACLDACPTGAFPAPYRMDARRCISYLTIEHRGRIPDEFHAALGNWVFGCDVCQEVCPYNRRAPVTSEPRFAIRPPLPYPGLEALMHWTTEDYRRVLRGSAMRRAKLGMLQRNAGLARRNITGQPVDRDEQPLPGPA